MPQMGDLQTHCSSLVNQRKHMSWEWMSRNIKPRSCAGLKKKGRLIGLLEKLLKKVVHFPAYVVRPPE